MLRFISPVFLAFVSLPLSLAARKPPAAAAGARLAGGVGEAIAPVRGRTATELRAGGSCPARALRIPRRRPRPRRSPSGGLLTAARCIRWCRRSVTARSSPGRLRC